MPVLGAITTTMDSWDLFMTDEASTGSGLVLTVNSLYHNNGDGTFAQVTNGSPVIEAADSFGCSWIDYDNDGFLDLFATRGDGRGHYLYHNNLTNVGNTNAWLTIKLVGTVSNRSAIVGQGAGEGCLSRRRTLAIAATHCGERLG